MSDEIHELRAEIERLRAYAKHEFSLGAEGPMIELTNARQEIERLRGERASDQQRLFHYEAEIERLTAENAELRAALQIWMQGRTLEQTPDQGQGQKMTGRQR